MAELDEKYLIDRCRRNDLDAFNQLVLKHQDRIFNSVYRIVNDHATSLDICQESFLRAFQSIKKFKGQSSFLTWLYQIALNLCYNYKRARKPITPLPANDLLGSEHQSSSSSHNFPNQTTTANNPRASMEQTEQNQLIQQALNSLVPDLRTVVVLKDIEGHSYQEMSGILKCSIGSIRARLIKARNILKQQLENLIY